MSRKETMKQIRAQTLLVRRLGAQLKAMSADGIASPRLDGMPRARDGAAGGLDIQYEKREAMRRIVERESALLRKCEREARREMNGMRPDLYAFCALYYIAALSIEEAAEAMDRSKRQCERYKSEVERG